jgi:hypothetical protein
MGIHYYVWLSLENEEEVEVEGEKTSPPPPQELQADSCFYFDICGTQPESPVNQGKPSAFATSLTLLKSFSLA